MSLDGVGTRVLPPPLALALMLWPLGRSAALEISRPLAALDTSASLEALPTTTCITTSKYIRNSTTPR